METDVGNWIADFPHTRDPTRALYFRWDLKPSEGLYFGGFIFGLEITPFSIKKLSAFDKRVIITHCVEAIWGERLLLTACLL